MNKEQEVLNIIPSGYRILFTFYTILNYALSQKELNTKLNENPFIDKKYTKEALIKFINTLKASDIDIAKIDNKYLIQKLPWKIDISKKSLQTLFELQNFTDSLLQENLTKEYNSFLENLFMYIDDDKLLIDNSRKYKINKSYELHSKIIKKIEKCTKSNQKIIVKDKNEETFEFDKFQVEYHKEKVYLAGYNVKLNENKLLDLSDIATLRLSPQKAQGVIFPPTVMFKLKDRLAAGYNLKSNEKLVSQNYNEIIISNKGEDKDVLMRRLLKYKELCEILSPEPFKKEFLALIKKSLSLYDL